MKVTEYAVLGRKLCRTEGCCRTLLEGQVVCSKCEKEYESGRIMMLYADLGNGTTRVTAKRIRSVE